AERILQYSTLTSERPAVIETNRPPPLWPSQGAIVFRDVQLRCVGVVISFARRGGIHTFFLLFCFVLFRFVSVVLFCFVLLRFVFVFVLFVLFCFLLPVCLSI